VVPGDRVAVQVEKCAEAVLLYVACLRTGAVFVPINVANTPTKLTISCVIRGLESQSSGRPTVRCSNRWQSAPGLLTSRLWALTARVIPRIRGAATRPRTTAEHCEFSGGDCLYIRYDWTIQRAMLTRANLASNAAALVETWRFTDRDVLLHTLPLFHIHGCSRPSTRMASASSLLLLPKFDASIALRHLPEATVLMGVPTYYTRLLQQAGLNRDSTHTCVCSSAARPVAPETHREFLQRTGHTILERYGMTETLINTSNPTTDRACPAPLEGRWRELQSAWPAPKAASPA